MTFKDEIKSLVPKRELRERKSGKWHKSKKNIVSRMYIDKRQSQVSIDFLGDTKILQLGVNSADKI